MIDAIYIQSKTLNIWNYNTYEEAQSNIPLWYEHWIDYELSQNPAWFFMLTNAL